MIDPLDDDEENDANCTPCAAKAARLAGEGGALVAAVRQLA